MTKLTYTAFRCDRGDCRKGFKYMADLLRHLRVHDNALLHCFFCPWTHFKESHFKDHLNHHYNIRPYTCTYCEKKFFDSASKLQHEHSHHEKISDRYKCRFCEFTSHLCTSVNSSECSCCVFTTEACFSLKKQLFVHRTTKRAFSYFATFRDTHFKIFFVKF